MPDNEHDKQLLQKIERRVDSNLPVRDDLLNDLANYHATPDRQHVDDLEARLIALAYQQHGDDNMDKRKNGGRFRRFAIPATFAAVFALIIIGAAALFFAFAPRYPNPEFAAPQNGIPLDIQQTATAIIVTATQGAQLQQGQPTSTPMPTMPFTATPIPNNASNTIVLEVQQMANVYSQARDSSAVIGIIEVGDVVNANRVITADGWRQIEFMGVFGWVENSRLKLPDEQTSTDEYTVVVLRNNAPIHSAPSSESEIIGGLVADVVVTIETVSDDGRWVEVALNGQTLGWMQSNDVAPEEGAAFNTSGQAVEPTRQADPFQLTATALITTATQGASIPITQTAEASGINPSSQANTFEMTATALVDRATQNAQAVQVTPTFMPTPTAFPPAAAPPNSVVPMPTDTRARQFGLSSPRILFHEDLEVAEGDEVQLFAAVLLADWDAVGSLDAADVTLDDLLRTETPLLTINEPVIIDRIVTNPDGSKLYQFRVNSFDMPVLEWARGTNFPFVLIVMTEEQVRALQEQS